MGLGILSKSFTNEFPPLHCYMNIRTPQGLETSPPLLLLTLNLFFKKKKSFLEAFWTYSSGQKYFQAEKRESGKSKTWKRHAKITPARESPALPALWPSLREVTRWELCLTFAKSLVLSVMKTGPKVDRITLKGNEASPEQAEQEYHPLFVNPTLRTRIIYYLK